ncbi:MAG: bifunctional 5,10-methylenetetrahydrofolate dehydrogenase/5,10-methenyltetrahydrofolate cyclohydrolase [Acidobacteriota bacterium]|jgi:methylenetetrahydrofolate dehydrogenase (NADP+)/methenyltetrahydrofolate cyclohydrolase|nr:MAG: bifunctional methylenetetrahydrofolate dehydrogenase/methenyltetrahydrofolate cyclohydrolase [Acidobacteriota bacterium]
MSARRLDGTAVAAAIRSELAADVAELTRRLGRPPSLSIVLVGDDPASKVYVRNKEKAGAEAGLAVTVHRLPATAALDDVLSLVRALNVDDRCDGILVQSPLPPAMGKQASEQVFDAIAPAKDVDGFHAENVGRLVQGRPLLPPCTPTGVIALLEREGVRIAGTHAVVIGRSDIVGKPMAMMLLQRDATVTICHSKTKDLAAVVRTGDIVVSAIGRPGYVTPEMIKPGAVVVDVGTTPVEDRGIVVRLFGPESPRVASFDRRGSTVVGDVHPAVAEVASALSPVPGGVGPLTITMLLRNTLEAARARLAPAGR